MTPFLKDPAGQQEKTVIYFNTLHNERVLKSFLSYYSISCSLPFMKFHAWQIILFQYVLMLSYNSNKFLNAHVSYGRQSLHFIGTRTGFLVTNVFKA